MDKEIQKVSVRGHTRIWLTASSYMVKYLRISSYIRKPFLIYDFAPDPIWTSLYMRKIFFSFLSVWDYTLVKNEKWLIFMTYFYMLNNSHWKHKLWCLQITKKIGSAKCHICGRSANLTNYLSLHICGIVELIVELIYGTYSIAGSTSYPSQYKTSSPTTLLQLGSAGRRVGSILYGLRLPWPETRHILYIEHWAGKAARLACMLEENDQSGEFCWWWYL